MPVRALGLLIACGILAGRTFAQDQLLRDAEQLDAEQKCDQAERLYQEVLANGAPSLAVLNNLGNHYLTCGSPEKARNYFERVLHLNPAHVNANLQLARLATDRKDGTKALQYLSRVHSRDAQVLLLRAEALGQSGKPEAAAALIDEVARTPGIGARLLFAMGIACARAALYDRAEAAFTKVLADHPDDYDVLYNLGLAAARAGHDDRAQHAFEVALKTRPNDIDSLYELGRVQIHRQDYNRAIYLLAQARKLAPQRPEIALALARAAEAAGYFGDSLLAYDSYLELQPSDDGARRDRALVKGYTQAGLQQGLSELSRYVKEHPADAVGYYDLAQLSDRVDRNRALSEVFEAVRLAPDFEPAHFFRGWLLEQLGRSAESLAEFQICERLNPHDSHALDLLGLDYLNLEKPEQAENALRKALALSPNDPEVIFHLSRSLIEQNRAKEAQPYIGQFQKLRKDAPHGSRDAPGVIASVSLTPDERSRRVVEELRRAVRSSPNDLSTRVNLGSALLAEGLIEEGTATFHDLLSMNPQPVILRAAATTLLHYEQYALARDFLQRATPEDASARLDLAVALFFSEGPAPALKVLEQVSDRQGAGDALLLKANILDASGKTEEADEALDQSRKYTTTRPRLAQQAALLWVRHHQSEKALDLVDRAIKTSPEDTGLALARVVVLSSLHRINDAEKAVRAIQHRWPEWDRPYVVEGLLMERESRRAEARERIQIALALGSQDAAARCALARVTGSTPSGSECACQPGIFEWFFSACQEAAPSK